MRTILTFIFLIACILPGLGQFPAWKIQPSNDTLLIMDGTSVIKGDKKGKITLWDMEGRQLFSTDDRLTRYYNGLATVLKKDSWEIIGFIDTLGKYTSVPHLSVAYNHPHFDYGFLVAKRKGKFALYSRDGKEQPLPDLSLLYPFSKGYAVYQAYENPEKMKKPFFSFLMSDGSPIGAFTLKEKDKEKTIEPKNIRFLSTVSEDGKSVAIIKNKLYWFDAENEMLTPILMGDETEKKRHLTLIEEKDMDFAPVDGKLSFTAKYGKEQNEVFEFDERLRLISGDKRNSATSSPQDARAFETRLTTYKGPQGYGLILDRKDSIPGQFEQVGLTYDNNAFVKLKGKWGVLELLPDPDMSISLYGGEVIPFRHGKFSTELRISLPCSIASKTIRIDIPDQGGCHLDLDSKESRDTKEGNYVKYSCIIDAPSNLTDSVTDLTFGPLELIHNNVRLHPVSFKAKGQYLTPYSISLNEKDLSLSNNSTVFGVTVIRDEEDGEQDYPYSFNVESDALQTRVEKVSDQQYQCTVEYIEEGLYDLDLILTEIGCPPSTFPLEITCSKKGKVSIGIKQPEVILENDSLNTAQSPTKTDGGKDNAGKRKPALSSSNKKTPLFIKYPDGYFVGEVIAQEPRLSSGPGDDFAAPTYDIEFVGKKEIPAPYKGQLIKVKDEGDWYLKYPSVDISQNPQPEYISKKSVTPVRSIPFELNEIVEPLIYVSYQDIYDEANNKGRYVDEIVTYPGGLCIAYCEGKTGSMIKFGNIIDGKPAIEWRYRVLTRDGGEIPQGSRTNVTLDKNLSSHRLRLTVAPQDRKTLKGKKEDLPYLDLTGISSDEWVAVLKDYLLLADLKVDNHEISDHECDILSRDMLEKNYTKADK